MSNDLTRSMLDDTLPKGPIWEPELDGDFDLLLDGIADNLEVQRLFLSTLSDIRNPLKTTILSDLEREYGIATNLLLSEATRRLKLAEIVFGRSSNGTEDDLQSALRNSGFDVYVYQNDPAVDPAVFLSQAFQMVAGGGNAYAGRADAFAGTTGGELLVNGDIFKTSRVFTSGAGSGFYAGTGHGAGEYDDLIVEKIEYTIPTDPDDWPLVFFVGGLATLGFIDLILNGGFETGDFTGWTQNSSTIDNTNPATGTWCSKLVGVGASSLQGAESANYDVDESREYTVKIKNDVTVYTAGFYRVALEFRDEDGLVLAGSPFLANINAVTGGYAAIEKTIGPFGSGADIIFPSGTRTANIDTKWVVGGNGTAFTDDFELYRNDKQSITAIDNATVDGTREDEFKSIILRYKPLHSWAALIVTFA